MLNVSDQEFFLTTTGLLQDAGSVFWKGRRADHDAEVVTLLVNAGAIPLALTNVPEMCMWGDAYNKLRGSTRNPYDSRRTPGGSSGAYYVIFPNGW